MAVPYFTLRQLLEAGVHFGHQTHRWNPKMGTFIHSQRNGIHIIDLTQTVPLLQAALREIEKVVGKGGTLLLVGTKRQAQGPVEEAAERCAQHFVNHRWLGGTLTNWKTVSNSISRLKSIDERVQAGVEGLTKKERLGMLRDQSKLQASLGGIREMGNVPTMLFVIDVRKEALAVAEAKKLGIPVIAVVDTNCSPDGIAHVIPGNDDAIRAIKLYCDLVARAAIEGMDKYASRAGLDVGEEIEIRVETAADEELAEEAAEEIEAEPEVEDVVPEVEPEPEPVEEPAVEVKPEETKTSLGMSPDQLVPIIRVYAQTVTEGGNEAWRPVCEWDDNTIKLVLGDTNSAERAISIIERSLSR
ncbi:MAG: 30S ribosomal protein S2 [Rhodobacteraceae bacterium]|nr:30S ribosomal protein S2 [Paracoccaceae bacterium]